MLNDVQILLLLLTKTMLGEKRHDPQFFMENCKGGIPYLCQSTLLLNFHSSPYQD